jgi:hypothetical protein
MTKCKFDQCAWIGQQSMLVSCTVTSACEKKWTSLLSSPKYEVQDNKSNPKYVLSYTLLFQRYIGKLINWEYFLTRFFSVSVSTKSYASSLKWRLKHVTNSNSIIFVELTEFWIHRYVKMIVFKDRRVGKYQQKRHVIWNRLSLFYISHKDTLFCDIKSFGGRIKCPVHSAKEMRFKWLLITLHVLSWQLKRWLVFSGLQCAID